MRYQALTVPTKRTAAHRALLSESEEETLAYRELVTCRDLIQTSHRFRPLAVWRIPLLISPTRAVKMMLSFGGSKLFIQPVVECSACHATSIISQVVGGVV